MLGLLARLAEMLQSDRGVLKGSNILKASTCQMKRREEDSTVCFLTVLLDLILRCHPEVSINLKTQTAVQPPISRFPVEPVYSVANVTCDLNGNTFILLCAEGILRGFVQSLPIPG